MKPTPEISAYFSDLGKRGGTWGKGTETRRRLGRAAVQKRWAKRKGKR